MNIFISLGSKLCNGVRNMLLNAIMLFMDIKPEISTNMQGITDISQSFSNEVRNANVEVNKSIELLEELVHKVESIRI